MNSKKDIMGEILAGNDRENEDLTRELDCLIYKSETRDPGGEPFFGPTEDSWKVSRENVSVQVWETKGKIRLRVSLGKGRQVSMKKIANIAVDAILNELKKED
jgi:hypothetical protein